MRRSHRPEADDDSDDGDDGPPRPRRGDQDDDYDDDSVELVMDADLVAQLKATFGVAAASPTSAPSAVVKVPTAFARQLHYYVVMAAEEREREEREEREERQEQARRLCRRDEQIALEYYKRALAEVEGLGGRPPGAGAAAESREVPDVDPELLDFIFAQPRRTSFEPETTQRLNALFAEQDRFFSASAVDGPKQVIKAHAWDGCLQDDTRVITEDEQERGPERRMCRKKQPSSKDHGVRPQSGGQGAGAGASRSRSVSPAQGENAFLGALGISRRKSLLDEEEQAHQENPWDAADPEASFERYRERAEMYRVRRNEHNRLAQQTFQQGRKDVAGYHTAQAQQCSRDLDRNNALAAAARLATMSNFNPDTLDLHYLRVGEALTVLDLFLDHHIRILSEDDATEGVWLSVVTGRGAHSPNHQPVLKPAVIRRASQRRLRFTEPRNPGVIRVFVTRDSALSHQIEEPASE